LAGHAGGVAAGARAAVTRHSANTIPRMRARERAKHVPGRSPLSRETAAHGEPSVLARTLEPCAHARLPIRQVDLPSCDVNNQLDGKIACEGRRHGMPRTLCSWGSTRTSGW